MIDHEEAKKIAYLDLKKIENVRILSECERKTIFPNHNEEIWEVVTEITGTNGLEEIILNIVFLPDFPLSLPVIFLGVDDYNRIKYIPHVEVSRLVCTYLHDAVPDPNKPYEIVEEAIRKAKRIIEDGISENNSSDFEEEFKAYWENKYSDKDSVLKNILILTEKPLDSLFKFIRLKKPLNSISYYIHQDETHGKNFKEFLDECKLDYSESEGFYIGEIEGVFKPPFNLNNRKAIEIIQNTDPTRFIEYKRYLNKANNPKLIMFSRKLNDELKYFGWFHQHPNLQRDGFRPGALKYFEAISKYEINSYVKRVSPEVFNPRRLIQRSSGDLPDSHEPIIYSIAGVGSIGSNLIHFLKSDLRAEFRLIDTDILKPENIGRHLLGFNHLNWKKTLGIKDYLKGTNPIREISTRELPIFEVVKDEAEYINDSSVLIVCIGEENTEKWIAKQIEKKVINIPVLFVWVEPYLAGGHCIYITPTDNTYNKYFDENGLFKFNIIHKDMYKTYNPVLSLREAGCQSYFMPYSSDQVMCFLGALYPHISNLIHSKASESSSFTWLGSRSSLADIKIDISEYGSSLNEGTINMNTI